MMEQLDGRPVVLGSSFSGLLMSLALSDAGIEHVLIGGDEPAEVPRLGESLNECASPAMWRAFGEEFPEFFYTKSHISLLNGDVASQVHIGNPNRNLESIAWLARKRRHAVLRVFQSCVTGKNLLHVDRVGLDRAIYHKAIAQPACRFVKQLVAEVSLNKETDRVEQLTLTDGSQLAPSYVFDTTGFRGLVVTAAGVGTRPLSNLQRVDWTHYRRDEPAGALREWWLRGTNLLRLDRESDGINGISWLIPLGQTLSLGVSVDEEECAAAGYDKSDVMRLLAEAYARRGVDYRRLFPHEHPVVQELKHRYYVRERAYGANWLLVGGTYVSIWFPSSAGIWTTVAAADMVGKLLENPARYGARYEKMLQPLLSFHNHLEAMIHGDVFQTEKEAYFFWSRWLAGILRRLSDYLRISSRQYHHPRPVFAYLNVLSVLFLRFPRLQMLWWGFVVNRVKYEPNLTAQSEAFDGYYKTKRFRLRNYLRGLGQFFRWFVPQPRPRPIPTEQEASEDLAGSTAIPASRAE